MSPQFREEVEDLALKGDVECAHRFVGNDDPRVHRQRAGDRHTLSLAAPTTAVGRRRRFVLITQPFAGDVLLRYAGRRRQDRAALR